MEKILFATGNAKKLKEADRILSPLGFEVLSTAFFGTFPEPEETGNTFEENAHLKAEYYRNLSGISCFAEDSGLEVESLKGAPGIYSARYAGQNSSDENNVHYLLEKMQGISNRKAKFTAVICYLELNSTPLFFRGEVLGTIADKPSGDSGFGYDPVFIPDGYNQTFAVLGSSVKDLISHRKKALTLLNHYLSTLKKP
jgi:XTP/dITP diphosphohydrolase